jgi:hypothetical protein
MYNEVNFSEIIKDKLGILSGISITTFFSFSFEFMSRHLLNVGNGVSINQSNRLGPRFEKYKVNLLKFMG